MPVKPTSSLDQVFTHYWVDNFDVKIDRINGGGPVNTTHLVVYQERRPEQTVNDAHTPISSVPKKKSRKLFIEDAAVKIKPVNKTAEPPELRSDFETAEVGLNHQKNFTLWLYT